MIILLKKTLLDDSSSTLPESTNTVGPFLNNIQFTPLEVQGVLETLELGKSTGPDNVNNRVLKELSAVLSIIIIIFYLDIPLYNGGNLSRGNWVASR